MKIKNNLILLIVLTILFFIISPISLEFISTANDFILQVICGIVFLALITIILVLVIKVFKHYLNL